MGRSGEVLVRRHILPVALWLLATACPGGGGGGGGGGPAVVTLPSSDATPPTVTLDVYGLPPQATSTPGNPESVNENCCFNGFTVNPSTSLTLVAAGRDADGGVKRITIRFVVVQDCRDPNNNTISERPDRLGNVARNEDPARPTPGTSVVTERITNGVFKVSDHDPGCPQNAPNSVDLYADIWATADNYHGMFVPTNRFRLHAG
jgi:hypothetical protein